MKNKKSTGDNMNKYLKNIPVKGALMLGMAEVMMGRTSSPTYSGNPTEIQKRIESNVTNGLGYEKKSGGLFYWDMFSNNYDRNTNEGLQIHLAEMDNKVKPDFELSNIITTYKKLATQMTDRDRSKAPSYGRLTFLGGGSDYIDELSRLTHFMGVKPLNFKEVIDARIEESSGRFRGVAKERNDYDNK